MKKQALQIELFPAQKQKVVYLKDHEYLVGEFRAYYKPYPKTGISDKQITCSADFNEFLKAIYEDCIEDTEQFVVVFLSKANKIIHYSIMSTGGLTGTIVDVQLILRHAILLNAKAMCLSHNHPSGNLKPSDADMSITRRLKDAAKLMDIAILDHIILTKCDYYSFADSGNL